MASRTTRRFTAGTEGPTVTESVQLSQSARARALRTQTEGLESDRRRKQQQATEAQSTAFYRGQGEYSTLGADGGYRPRGNVTSGGVATGQRVPANGGLVGGMPAGGGGDGDTLAIAERLARVALDTGPQLGTARPTPNVLDASDPATDIRPRYPQDRYFQSTTGQAWQWVPAVGEDAGYWDVAAPVDQLPVGIDSPAVEHYPGMSNRGVRYRVDGYTIVNELADGSEGTTGAAELKVNGAAVTLGTTLLQPGDRISVSVTSAGTGRMVVTIELRQI